MADAVTVQRWPAILGVLVGVATFLQRAPGDTEGALVAGVWYGALTYAFWLVVFAGARWLRARFAGR